MRSNRVPAMYMVSPCTTIPSGLSYDSLSPYSSKKSGSPESSTDASPYSIGGPLLRRRGCGSAGAEFSPNVDELPLLVGAAVGRKMS